MMTLDECIAAARLPISVDYNPNNDVFSISAFVNMGGYSGMYGTSDYLTPDRAPIIRKAYVALRTHLSEQQGEKR